MIALLKGQIAFKSIDHLILEVGGVGYRLLIPLSTFYALPDEGPVRLHVHTHVREDAIHLYGFLTSGEREMFGTLLSVSGVGPKLALNVLSHIPVPDLNQALGSGDVKRLSGLPGIGRKTAERLVLELKEKARKLTAGQESAPAAAPGGSGNGPLRRHPLGPGQPRLQGKPGPEGPGDDGNPARHSPGGRAQGSAEDPR